MRTNNLTGAATPSNRTPIWESKLDTRGFDDEPIWPVLKARYKLPNGFRFDVRQSWVGVRYCQVDLYDVRRGRPILLVSAAGQGVAATCADLDKRIRAWLAEQHQITALVTSILKEAPMFLIPPTILPSPPVQQPGTPAALAELCLKPIEVCWSQRPNTADREVQLSLGKLLKAAGWEPGEDDPSPNGADVWDAVRPYLPPGFALVRPNPPLRDHGDAAYLRWVGHS